MQLISILLFIVASIIFGYAILFISRWHRAHSEASVVHKLRCGIGHIGVSAVVEHPKTIAPILALLEEVYPRSEVIAICDQQREPSLHDELVRRFRLIRVNHSHLSGVRTLYRSRNRVFRRIVLIDLPVIHQHRAVEIAKEVATYDYTLYLQGESIISHGIVAYCANLIASRRVSKSISLQTLVGERAILERSDRTSSESTEHLLTPHAIAWRRESLLLPLLSLLAPAAIVAIAHLTGEEVMLMVAIIISLTMALLLYLSYRIMATKGLLATFGTIVRNFYCFLIERVEIIYYLYGRRVRQRDNRKSQKIQPVTAPIQPKQHNQEPL